MTISNQSLKEQVKQFRKQVKELQEQFTTINDALLAQISADDELNITTDLGKLQFYLVDEVTSGFSQVTTGLHRIWDTFPAEPKEAILQAAENMPRDAAGDVTPDNVDGSGSN